MSSTITVSYLLDHLHTVSSTGVAIARRNHLNRLSIYHILSSLGLFKQVTEVNRHITLNLDFLILENSQVASQQFQRSKFTVHFVLRSRSRRACS